MGFLFYIMAKSHNLASNFTKSLGVALKMASAAHSKPSTEDFLVFCLFDTAF